MVVFILALVIVSPLIVISWVEKLVSRSEVLFVFLGQFLSMVPGLIGTYLRGAFYFGTIDECSWETHLGFGTFFTHRAARLEREVSTGAYCVLGHASLEQGVRLASRVSVPSGKRQHLDDAGQIVAENHFERVTIGRDTWVGEGAIVMADVGASSIVSAGAIVTRPTPSASIVGGNPAKVLKALDELSPGS